MVALWDLPGKEGFINNLEPQGTSGRAGRGVLCPLCTFLWLLGWKVPAKLDKVRLEFMSNIAPSLPEQREVRTKSESQRPSRRLQTLSLPRALQFYEPVIKE